MILTVLREKNIFEELDDVFEMIFLEDKDLKAVADNSRLMTENFINANLKDTVCRDVILFC
jgi:hypothetical protein